MWSEIKTQPKRPVTLNHLDTKAVKEISKYLLHNPKSVLIWKLCNKSTSRSLVMTRTYMTNSRQARVWYRLRYRRRLDSFPKGVTTHELEFEWKSHSHFPALREFEQELIVELWRFGHFERLLPDEKAKERMFVVSENGYVCISYSVISWQIRRCDAILNVAYPGKLTAKANTTQSKKIP